MCWSATRRKALQIKNAKECAAAETLFWPWVSSISSIVYHFKKMLFDVEYLECHQPIKEQKGSHLVQLTDVILSVLRSVHLLHQGSHAVELHGKLPLALGSLTHPLFHDLHQVEFRVQQPHDGCVCLWTPQVLPKTHPLSAVNWSSVLRGVETNCRA